MSTGTLIVHHTLDVLTGLAALTRIETSNTSTVYVDDPANPAVRIVFLNDPAVPGSASSFTVTDGTGTTLYADGHYAVSLTALDAAISASNMEGARAVLFDALTALALAPDADVDLTNLKAGLTFEGNELATEFTLTKGAATVHAGGGDDSISLWADFNEGQIDGGDGYDTLWVDGPVAITVSAFLHKISVNRFNPSTWLFDVFNRPFDDIEFFRGSAGTQIFEAVGEGMRFEGGAGRDNFYLLSEGAALVDIVDFGGEQGSRGVAVNLGYDSATSPAMDSELAAALTAVLDGVAAPGKGFARDTFGELDNLSTGFIVEGTARADVFFGSGEADAFLGDDGDDHFIGADGDDRIDGGGGSDTFYLSRVRDDYDVGVEAGVLVIAAKDGSGTDEVTGVEHFRFAGVEYAAADLAPAATSPPAAVDDDNGDDAVIEAAAGVPGDASATGNVLDNDSDADGDQLSVVGIRAEAADSFEGVGVVNGLYGQLAIAADGNWSYVLDDSRPATDALPGGTTIHDIFTYRIGAGTDFAEATLDIMIGGSNDAPLAAEDALAIDEDVALVLAASSLTNNDVDPEGDLLSVIAVGGPSHGTVALLDGNITFTPEADYFGLAGFSYTVEDPHGRTATQQVNVTVGSVNDAPQASDDAGSELATAEDTALTISAARLLGNDSDADGDALTIAEVGGGVGGTVVLEADRSVSFTPDADFNGEASFSYRVKDGAGALSAAATVVVDVTLVNDVPVANDDSGSGLTTAEDTALTISAARLLGNDSDADGDALTIASIGNAVGGKAVLNSNGSVTFTPAADFNGAASFSYRVKDSPGALSEAATVAVDVTPVNDAPVANNDSGSGLTTAEDTALTISAARLLGNDHDADGDALTIASIGNAVGGKAVLNGNGSVTFTPAADFNGDARFTYRAKDAAGGVSSWATAVVLVTPVNDAPSFGGRGIVPSAAPAVRENTTTVMTLSSVDVDSAAISYRVAGRDAAAFRVDGNVLRFVAPVDYETPTDWNGDNIYEVSVVASDGQLTDARSLAIGVLDTAGNVVRGTSGAERIDGRHGSGGKTATDEEDRLDGRKGGDDIRGGDGNDTISGGKGDDGLRGNDGDDLLRGGKGEDKINGGAGQDTADYSDATDTVSVLLAGSHNAWVRIDGVTEDKVKNVENIVGGKGADVLIGDSEVNLLVGNRGKDVLAGRLGADTLSGGRGRDQFMFDVRPEAGNADLITDFQHNDDLIVLEDRMFRMIGSKLNKRELYAHDGADAPHDRNDRIIYDAATGELYYDADGIRGGYDPVHFATLAGAPTIDVGDFLIA